MKLREYEYILAIAKEESMLRAAQKLYISQPALSKLLSNVENELGVQLFERNARKLTPTPAGRAYLENAQRLVELNEQLARNVRRSVTEHKITIAHPMVYSSFFLTTMMPALRVRFPAVSVDTRVISQKRLTGCLLEGDAPFAIGLAQEENTRLLEMEPIGEIEMVLAAPICHPLAAEARPIPGCTYPYLSPEALAKTPFLLSRPESFSAQYTSNYLRMNGLTPPVALTTPFTYLLFDAVGAGTGVAILPSIPLKHMNLENAVTYYSIEQPSVRKTVGIFYRKNRQLTETERAIIDIMKDMFD